MLRSYIVLDIENCSDFDLYYLISAPYFSYFKNPQVMYIFSSVFLRNVAIFTYSVSVSIFNIVLMSF